MQHEQWWTALRNGYSIAVQRMLHDRPGLLYAYLHGASPLHLAIQHPDTVQALLDEGAETATRSADGETALMQAAGLGLVAVVEVLLSAGADPNLRSAIGWTAVHCAVRPLNRSAQDAERARAVIELLMGSGATLDLADRQGQSPLWWAVFTCRESGNSEQWLDMVDWLINKGANVNLQDHTGDTLLHALAAPQAWGGGWRSSPTLERLLITRGGDRSIQNDKHKRAVDLLEFDQETPSRYRAEVQALFQES